MLKPGLYRLIVNINSPHPDGRSTHRSDWRKHKVWKADLEFIVRPAFRLDDCIAPRDERFWSLHAANPGDDEYKVLSNALDAGQLVPFTEESIASVVDRTECSGRDILERLLSDGTVNIKTIEETALKIKAEDLADREVEAKDATNG